MHLKQNYIVYPLGFVSDAVIPNGLDPRTTSGDAAKVAEQSDIISSHKVTGQSVG